jgi:hypothetical protein
MVVSVLQSTFPLQDKVKILDPGMLGLYGAVPWLNEQFYPSPIDDAAVAIIYNYVRGETP